MKKTAIVFLTILALAGVATAQDKKASAPKPESFKIMFHSDPDPLKTGENKFEVMVTDATGKRVTDGEVSLQFHMAAMPQMKMPEMKNTVTLKHAGDGIYKGSGQVMMAGEWTVMAMVMRSGKEVGSRTLKLTAK